MELQPLKFNKIYNRFIKYILDFLMVCIAIIFLSPLMIITSLVIFIEDGWPIIFVHSRIGRSGKMFSMYKFRSMKKQTPLVESKIADQEMITRTGRIIRRWNIDELPQLFNVLLQQMSLVGPRPTLPQQKNLNELRTVNGSSELRPGLTGLAQVKSYDGMSEEIKARYDKMYLQEISFSTDIKIILKTFKYLLKRPPKY